jgi:branched-chain amino acid transport system substrate-binding protein
VGYDAFKGIAAGIAKTGSTDSEKLAEAFKDLTFDSPSGKITFTAIDHQSTFGLYVGRTDVKDGKGYMKTFEYIDGSKLQPPDDEVKQLRPASAD